MLVGDDDSVVLAGHTEGEWSTTSAGYFDFAAVKVDADGEEVWRWQVSARGVADARHPFGSW